MSEFSSNQIATELSSVWSLAKGQHFLDYLKDTFGVIQNQLPQFRCLYIIQAQYGNLIHGPGGGPIFHRWQVDDEGIREVGLVKEDLDDVPFYATPRIKFYVEADMIMIVESYGPLMMVMKRGKLVVAESGVKISLVEILMK